MARILCVIDGMTDGGFDVSNYPALASFAVRSQVKTVPDGFIPETLPCVLTLLGVTPPQNIRGWIEALGAGVNVNESDLVFRGSWMRVNEEGVCVSFCDAPEHIPATRHGKYIALGGYRCLFILPGSAAYANALDMKPPYELFGTRLNGQSGLPLLDAELALINKAQMGRALSLWNPSTVKTLPAFPQKAAVVTGVNVVKGIAMSLSMTLVANRAMTGDTDTDLQMKLANTLRLADEFPFVLLHIGGCDEAAHRKDRAEKETFLKRVDEIVIAGLLSSRHSVSISSDHGCDPSTGKHTGGLQPLYRLSAAAVIQYNYDVHKKSMKGT